MKNILETVKSSKQENGKTTYTIRENYGDDESKTLDIREAENGWIIRISHSYYEGKEGERRWKCDEKEYVSFENPMEKIKTKEEKKTELTSGDIASSINSFLSTFSLSNKLII